MKKRLTKGEKWLFASPLLFMIIAGAVSQWRRTSPYSLELPDRLDVLHLEFSPDGKQLVAIFDGTDNQPVAGRVYDLEARAVIGELEKPSLEDIPLSSFGFSGGYSYAQPSWSADGKSIVSDLNVSSSSDDSSQIVIWDTGGNIKMQQGHPLNTLEAFYTQFRKPVQFSEDGTSVSSDGIPPARFDVKTGKPLNWPDRRIPQEYALFNEKLGLVATSNEASNGLRIIDFKTRKLVWSTPLQAFQDFGWYGDLLCINENPTTDGGNLKVKNRLWLWDGKTRRLLDSPPLLKNAEIDRYSLDLKHNTIAYAQGAWGNSGRHGEVVVWDYRAKRVLWRYQQQGESVDFSNLQWSPDGRWLALIDNRSYLGDGPNILTVLDSSGNVRLTREVFRTIARWSSDSTQLAVSSGVADKTSYPTVSNRIEIYRF